MKSVENFVLTQKLLCFAMNSPFDNFWYQGQKWNRAVTLRIYLTLFFEKWFNLWILQLLGKELSLIEKLQSWDIDRAKISAPSFKYLPDKLSMPAALVGFKPFKIFNIFSEHILWKLKIQIPWHCFFVIVKFNFRFS